MLFRRKPLLGSVARCPSRNPQVLIPLLTIIGIYGDFMFRQSMFKPSGQPAISKWSESLARALLVVAAYQAQIGAGIKLRPFWRGMVYNSLAGYSAPYH